MHKSQLTKQTILLLGSLYTTQFVAFAFFSVAIVAIWREGGMSLEQLGFVSLLSMVWVIKFLWSPMVEKYIQKHQGNFKKFLLIVQSLLVTSILLVSVFDVNADKGIIFTSLVFIGLLSATQDIATEGLAYKILKKSERGFGGTLKTIGGILGYVLGAGVALSIYEQVGWEMTIFMLAFLSSLTLFQLLLYKESNSTITPTDETISWRIFYRFWNTRNKKIWLVFLILFPIGMSIASGLLVPLLVDKDWDLEKIGLVKGVIGSVLGILSAIASGWVLKYYSRKSILIGVSLIEVVGFLFLLMLHDGNTNMIINALAIGTVFISYGASMPIISALIMDHIENFPTAEYALQFTIYMFVGVVAGAGGVSLSGVFGYETMIIASSVFSLLTMLFVVIYFREIEYERA